MLTNRTSLFTFAAVAALALAASTGAEAGFICQRGMGGFAKAKAYSPMPQPRVTGKVPSVRPKDDEQYAKAASRKPPAAAPVKPTVVVGAAKPATSVEVSDGSAVNAPKPASVANTAVSTPTATATKACLTKEYLDTGAIRFRDTCTKEWAINSTNVDDQSVEGRPRLLDQGKQSKRRGDVQGCLYRRMGDEHGGAVGSRRGSVVVSPRPLAIYEKPGLAVGLSPGWMSASSQ